MKEITKWLRKNDFVKEDHKEINKYIYCKDVEQNGKKYVILISKCKCCGTFELYVGDITPIQENFNTRLHDIIFWTEVNSVELINKMLGIISIKL